MEKARVVILDYTSSEEKGISFKYSEAAPSLEEAVLEKFQGRAKSGEDLFVVPAKGRNMGQVFQVDQVGSVHEEWVSSFSFEGELYYVFQRGLYQRVDGVPVYYDYFGDPEVRFISESSEPIVQVYKAVWDEELGDIKVSIAPEKLAKELSERFAKFLRSENSLYYIPAGGATIKEIFGDEFIFGGFEQWVTPYIYEGELIYVFEWSC